MYSHTHIHIGMQTHATECIALSSHFMRNHPFTSNSSLFNPTLVPTAPFNLTANATSASSIQLAWNQPILLNGALHDYKIRYKLPSDSVFRSLISAGMQLTYDVSGLTPYTDYELQVRQCSFNSQSSTIAGYCRCIVICATFCLFLSSNNFLAFL